MKVKEITVGTSRKIGLPGYSSFDASAFITVALDEKDDVKEAYKKSWETVEIQVLKTVKRKGLQSPVTSEMEEPEEPEWLKGRSPDTIPSVKPIKNMKERD